MWTGGRKQSTAPLALLYTQVARVSIRVRQYSLCRTSHFCSVALLAIPWARGTVLPSFSRGMEGTGGEHVLYLCVCVCYVRK